MSSPRRAALSVIGAFSIAGIAAALPALSHSAAGTAPQQCAGNTIVQTPDGPRCGYVVQLVPVDSTRSGFDLHGTPTLVIVRGFEQVPGIGYFIGAAFAAERNTRHVVTLKAPPGYESYVLAGKRDRVRSETGAADWHFASTLDQ